MSDDIVIRFSVVDDGSPVIEKVNKKLGETSKQSKALVPGLESARKGLTDFASSNAALIGVLVGVGLALKKSFDDYNQYLDVVRETSRSLGVASEEAGRLIQVADDVGISVDALTISLKMAQKDGINPNIDGLAAMSDEYLALAPGVDRAQYLLDKFGRSGEQMGKLMDLGSAAIKRQADAVEDSLAPTQKALDEQRKFQVSVDALGDSWTALTYKVMPPVIKGLTDILYVIRTDITALQMMANAKPGEMMTPAFYVKLARAQIDSADANLMLKRSADDAGGAFQTEADKAKAVEDALKNLSEANAATIQGAIDLTKQNRDFNQSQSEILSTIDELKAKKAEYYPWETEKIADVDKQIDEQGKKYEENQAKFRAAMEEKFVLMALDKIAMSDGVAGFSDAEMAKAEALLKTSGIANQAGIDEQLAMQKLTDAVSTGQISVEDFGKILDSVMADGVASVDEVTSALNAVPKNITTTYTLETINVQTLSPIQQANYPNAGGGSFTIPYGGGNESFMLPGGNTASPGETVTIDKANQPKDIDYDRLARAISAANDFPRLVRMMRDAILLTGR